MTTPESIPQDSEEYQELSPVEYLRNLSDRLMEVPCMYGTDQYDCDRLNEIAHLMEQRNLQNDAIARGEPNE